jgi:hypothetical protein
MIIIDWGGLDIPFTYFLIYIVLNGTWERERRDYGANTEQTPSLLLENIPFGTPNTHSYYYHSPTYSHAINPSVYTGFEAEWVW